MINFFKYFFIKFIFFIHLLIFLAFPLGFFIPSRLWPERIEWHFWFTWILCALFFMWGLIWTLTRRDKVYSVCMLDTLTQYLRGFPLHDPRNFRHSFTEELCKRFGMKKFPHTSIRWALLFCVFLSGGLFVLKQYGIVWW